MWIKGAINYVMLLAAAIAALAAAYLPALPSSWWDLAAQAAAAALVCVAAFWALDTLAVPERQRINALLGRKLLPV